MSDIEDIINRLNAEILDFAVRAERIEAYVKNIDVTLDSILEALTPSDRERVIPKHMESNRPMAVGSKVYAIKETPYAMKGEWGVVIHLDDAFVKVMFASGGLRTIKRDEAGSWIENSGIVVLELENYVWVNFAQTMDDWKNGVFDNAIKHQRIN